MYFTIKELKIEEEGESGVSAISFVDQPAIQTDFQYFAKGKLLPYFKFTAYPLQEVIATSHDFCKQHAGNVYHTSEIKKWKKDGNGWIDDSNYFENFNEDMGGINHEGTYSFNCDGQLYNCRHKLVRVSRKSEVPDAKKYLSPENFESEHFVKIEMVSEQKREVQGLVMKSNMMIYRNDANGDGQPGYVFFSKDTIKKIQQKYGYNRNITYQHRDDITGQAILMESWIEETDGVVMWFMKYKIIGDKLWQQIKNKVVNGFSVEALFSI